jgi:hypothetical protein
MAGIPDLYGTTVCAGGRAPDKGRQPSANRTL